MPGPDSGTGKPGASSSLHTRRFEESDVEQSIIRRFEEQVASFADRPAVLSGGRLLTYRDLNATANRTGSLLLDHLTADDQVIAFYLEDRVDAVITLLGILKAGKAYLSLDTTNPAARLQNILRDADTHCIVTRASSAAAVREITEPLGINVLTLEQAEQCSGEENLGIYAEPGDLAALFYTSGSAGEPKAIGWSHRNIINKTWVYTNQDDLTEQDRISLITPLSFGASTSMMFAALLNGAALFPYIPQHEGLMQFAEWIDANRLTILHPPIALFRRFAEMLPEHSHFPSLRIVILGGDVLRPEDVALFRTRFHEDCVLIHQLAAHETTLIARNVIARDETFPNGRVPVGFPAPGREVLILNEDGEPLPAGEEGEIAVRSRYLATGYWKRPDLDRKTFFADPDGKDRRLCLTGDLGRMRPDGRLEFLGRKDFRIKVRGHSVELGAVERVLLSQPGVRDAIVTVYDNTRLVAYVVLQPDNSPTTSSLRTATASQLPVYMIPAAFVMVDSIPLTVNGKVDRKALPAPDFRQRDPAMPYVAPRNTVERFLVQIWQETLGFEPIGITDVFTEIGGDSLQALTIFSKIELEFGKRLPLNVLAEARTIQELAPEVRKEPIAPPWPSLVPLHNPEGSVPPLFLVHGAGGHVYTFHLFARALGTDQPVYALRSQGLDGITVPYHSYEEMAAHYIREIREVQPSGPYYLSGFSGGGKIAFEMAQQLLTAGERIALLAAIDTVVTEKITPDEVETDPDADLVEHSTIKLGTVQIIRMLVRRMLRLTKGPDPMGDPRWSPEKRIRWANRLASARYQFKPYKGNIILFRTEEMKHQRYDPRSFWEPWISGKIELIDIPGTHDSIHREPDVSVLAEKFAVVLQAAQRGADMSNQDTN